MAAEQVEETQNTIKLNDYDMYCVSIDTDLHTPFYGRIKSLTKLSDMNRFDKNTDAFVIPYSDQNMPLINEFNELGDAYYQRYYRGNAAGSCVLQLGDKTYNVDSVSVRDCDLSAKPKRDRVLREYHWYINCLGEDHSLYGKNIAIIHI